MRHLSIDIETFSDIDLGKAGLYRYAQSPNFQILLLAYSYDNEPVNIVDLASGEKIPEQLYNDIIDAKVIKHAYNAAFEWYCLSTYLYKDPMPWPTIKQWRCTMLHGLYCGYTAGLAATARALGLSEDKQKMKAGAALIRIFSIPQKPTKSNGMRTRTLPEHEPDKWNLFKEYCKQDVVTEMEIENKLSAFPIPVQEQKLWVLDQIMNANGIPVDLNLIEGALYCSDYITEELEKEAVELSGLDNPKSVQQLKTWLEEEINEEINDLQKETVKSLIKTTENETAKRMLEIRQELSKTSVKKYSAMDEAVGADGRVRGLLQFYGANRTGRWAGRLVQVQNLPRNYLETLSLARDCVKSKNIDALKIVYGNIPDTLSQLIRTAFVPSINNVFLVADFSAIEARVIAWLAGEQWVMDVFAGHGKIYEATASAMFGVPIEKITKGEPEYSLRQKGKVATLALGYQGGSGALIKMGALTMGLTEEELPDIVHRWRNANRRIVDLWYSVENAAIEALQTGMPIGVQGLLIAHESDFETGQDFLTITLPSKRKLFYAKPFLSPNQWGKPSIHYYGMDQTSKKWGITDTYGGKLVENIVQAIARDCLAVSMLRLQERGYQIVMHVHDEVIIDAPIGTDLKTVCDIMGEPISWAPGLLLRAEGFETQYYKKE